MQRDNWLFSFVLCISLSIISFNVVPDANPLEKGKSHFFSLEYDRAFKLLLPAANNNHPEAQYYVGLLYSTESWKKFDINNALKYLLSAADQNYAPAMWKVGDIYENNLAENNSLVLATDWYRKARLTEKKQAMIQFLKENPDGKLTPVSNDEMINMLTKQARAGDAEAQSKLGKIYDDGVLTQQDATKAFEWYLAAARNNNQHAQFMVGYFYCRKIGTEFNLEKSSQWFARSGRKAQCVTQ